MRASVPTSTYATAPSLMFPIVSPGDHSGNRTALTKDESSLSLNVKRGNLHLRRKPGNDIFQNVFTHSIKARPLTS